MYVDRGTGAMIAILRGLSLFAALSTRDERSAAFRLAAAAFCDETMSELEDPLVGGAAINSASLGPERSFVAILCAFGAAVGAVVFGYSLGFSSPALPGMEDDVFTDVECGKDDAVTSALASLWSSIVNVGCMVGAIGGARLLDAVGRRGALAAVAGPVYAATWALTATATTPGALIGARVALGVAVGVASVAVPVYIAETAPPSLRGALGAANQLAVTLGIFGVYLIGFLLPHETIRFDCGSDVRAMGGGGWRVLAWIGCGGGCFLVAVGLLLPETPSWLARRGRLDAAERSLRTLRGGDEARAALELRELVAKRDKDAAEADAAVGFGEILRMLAPGGVGGPVDGAVRAPLRIALAVMLIQQSRAASRGREDARDLSTAS